MKYKIGNMEVTPELYIEIYKECEQIFNELGIDFTGIN